ncbi:MAG: hypothetical protein K9N23_01515 [Akkermansiaceae bacterium]|nr:hypothetical protein [Akkermansiaceae bacterium]MCF7730328.1 hypothetical protein [Akkermansiaceae bacterium]
MSATPSIRHEPSELVPAGSGPEEVSIADRFSVRWSRCEAAVRAYLIAHLGNLSNLGETLNEVAVLTWQKGPHDATQEAFLGFSLACAKRLALAANRKDGDTRVRFLDPALVIHIADEVSAQDQRESDRPLLQRLDACLNKITAEQRELLRARYGGRGHGQELHRLATERGRPLDTLYKQLERLRSALRHCVQARATSNP